VTLQSILLTLLEKEIWSCEQVISSLRMNQTVIQPYFDVALDVIHHEDEHGLLLLRSVAFLVSRGTLVDVYTPFGVIKN
jgi:hypothetical protein